MKAGAESGWDFSSRWFISNGTGPGKLIDIATSEIIPVDLNAFLQRNAHYLSIFNKLLGNELVSIKTYLEKYQLLIGRLPMRKFLIIQLISQFILQFT